MRIIETEAYYGKGKAGILSHSYHKNKSKSERFDSGIIPGTVYMYFAHGGDSINFSCGNQGSAVLIKSGFPASNDPIMLQKMVLFQKEKACVLLVTSQWSLLVPVLLCQARS